MYTVTITVAAPSNLTALTSAISTAQSIYDSAVEGSNPGQYPAPLKANLFSAINTASAITGASSQSVVDAAVVTLNSAVTTFNSGVVAPSSLAILKNSIFLAQTNISNAVAGVVAGNYAQASINTFRAAITVAQGITSAMAQTVVNAAKATLNTAISMFQSSRVLATDQINLTTNTTLSGDKPQAVMTSSNTSASVITAGAFANNNATLDTSSLLQNNSVTLTGLLRHKSPFLSLGKSLLVCQHRP